MTPIEKTEKESAGWRIRGSSAKDMRTYSIWQLCASQKVPSVSVATARPSVMLPLSVHNALHSAANTCSLLATKHSTTSRRWSSVAISAISSNGKRKRNVKEAFHDEMANRYGDVIRIKSQCCQFLFLCKKKKQCTRTCGTLCVSSGSQLSPGSSLCTLGCSLADPSDSNLLMPM